MRKIYFSVIACCLFVGVLESKAQTDPNQNRLFSERSQVFAVTPADKSIKGTPYLNKDWVASQLLFTNNQAVDNIKLKYNIYLDELLALKPTGDSVALNNASISEFNYRQNLTVVRFINLKTVTTNAAGIKNTFVEVLYEGDKLRLIKDYRGKIAKAEKLQNTYSNQRTNDEYLKEEVYYVLAKDQAPTEVKLNKKNLLKVLSDKADKIEAYLKREKIDAGTEQGWEKALTYYGKL